MNRYFFRWICLTIWCLLFIPQVKASVLSSYMIKIPENEKAILVEKQTQTLSVYENKGGEIALIFQAPCSTGEVGGVKQRSGDKKTPEGIYFLTDEYEDRYLSPVYGKKAFPIDYPNFMDKRAGKNGSAIWIHGTNKPLKPMDSNGCIALENENVVKLTDYIALHSTPLIIVDTLKNANADFLPGDHKARLEKFLDSWRMNLLSGTYHQYLALYSPYYVPDIEFWEQWLKTREQLKTTDPLFKILTDRPGIYFDGRMVTALFDQYLKIGDKKVFYGKRKLFLLFEDNAFKIVGDVYQDMPELLSPMPLLAAAQKYLKPAREKESAVKMVKLWMTAWSKKAMDEYAGFYARGFYADGMNKKQWVSRKKKLANKYAYIHVEGRQFDVSVKNDTCIVDFFQIYESSGFKTQGTKRLKLIYEEGSWKIYRESWKEK